MNDTVAFMVVGEGFDRQRNPRQIKMMRKTLHLEDFSEDEEELRKKAIYRIKEIQKFAPHFKFSLYRIGGSTVKEHFFFEKQRLDASKPVNRPTKTYYKVAWYDEINKIYRQINRNEYGSISKAVCVLKSEALKHPQFDYAIFGFKGGAPYKEKMHERHSDVKEDKLNRAREITENKYKFSEGQHVYSNRIHRSGKIREINDTIHGVAYTLDMDDDENIPEVEYEEYLCTMDEARANQRVIDPESLKSSYNTAEEGIRIGHPISAAMLIMGIAFFIHFDIANKLSDFIMSLF